MSDVEITKKEVLALEQRQVQYRDGEYFVDIDITVDEWKSMLADEKIFNTYSLDMIRKWYSQVGYQSTSGEIITLYRDEYNDHKASPFNGIVKGLSHRILLYLQRFEIIGTKGEKSFWCVPFEGWYENNQKSGAFVWKLRKELVQAIGELSLFEDACISINNELESIFYVESAPEGRKNQYYTTRYERSQKNRNAAIQIHGLSCCVCGFNFEDTYGELGKNYIEVHHNKPLHSNDEEIIPDPKTDLDCVCANCHRMMHRKKDRILSISDLKNIIERAKKM